VTSAHRVPAAGWQGGIGQGLCYGALGLPLAFVALPLYVVLPNHYASEFGIPLGTLGALLLGARLLDAFSDPWIGRWIDRWFAGSATRLLAMGAAAAAVLALGFRGLFFPPVQGSRALLAWCAVLLAVTYLSYSVLSVMHQSWGARLGGDAGQRTRIVAWRESLALVGVIVASVLPALAGLGAASAVFAITLLVALAALTRAPRPPFGPAPSAAAMPRSGAAPGRNPVLHNAGFRALLAVYLANGVASAIPATLVLFFIRDRLQAQAWEPLFLASYFMAAALSMPMWVQLVKHLGLARAWLAGMGLAIVTFAWAAWLGPGDIAAYTGVCLASGVALGADLSLPGALLTGVIQRAGHGGKLEGAYFGWWNFATKFNLALAAGISLPLLGAFGYAPGSRDDAALRTLGIAYCGLPCALKLGAAALLWTVWLRKESIT
jgi:Na+/melibiose symporter-like transporter